MKFYGIIRYKKNIFLNNVVELEIELNSYTIKDNIAVLRSKYEEILLYNYTIVDCYITDCNYIQQYIFDFSISKYNPIRIYDYVIITESSTSNRVFGLNEYRHFFERWKDKKFKILPPKTIVKIRSHAKYNYGLYTPYGVILNEPLWPSNKLIYNIAAVGYINNDSDIGISDDKFPSLGLSISEMEEISINSVPDEYKEKINQILINYF